MLDESFQGLKFILLHFSIKLSNYLFTAPDRCPDIPEISGVVDGDYRRTSSPLTTLPQKEKSKGFKKIFGKYVLFKYSYLIINN